MNWRAGVLAAALAVLIHGPALAEDWAPSGVSSGGVYEIDLSTIVRNGRSPKPG